MRWAERSAAGLAALGMAAALAAAPWAAAAQTATSTRESGTPPAVLDRVVSDPRITESSGLAVSRRHDGVLWTHNDSGDAARLYAIGPDGSTLATVTITGGEPRDLEAMASSVDANGTPLLWVGDIGDNSGSRVDGILVHRLEEPAELTDAEVTPTSYRLRYPGSPVDAESLLVDPRDGRLFVATKTPVAGTVYAAPRSLDPAGANPLEPLGDTPDFLTDGAFLPDGRMLVRGYGAMWAGTPGDGWGEPRELPPSDQGESLAVSPDGAAVYVGSEGVRSKVWRLALPAALAPGAVPAPAPSPGSAPDSTQAYGFAWAVPLLVGGLTLMLTLAILLVRRPGRFP